MRRNFVLGVLVIFLFYGVMMHQADVTAIETGWTDDFNDGNYDGWIVVNGTWSASSNYLNATGSIEHNSVFHASTVMEGNFSFDIFADETVNTQSQFGYMISFASEAGLVDYGGVYYPENGFFLEIHFTTLNLWRVTDGTYGQTIGDLALTSLDGWYSVNVSIMSNYSIKVWVDGDLEIDEISLTRFSNIERFFVQMPEGGAIDNIVVNGEEIHSSSTTTATTNSTTQFQTPTTASSSTSTPTTDTTTEITTTTEPITPQPIDTTTLILIGAGAGIVLLIVIVLVVKKR